jgi:class 3 adenylate cyclase
VAAATLEETNFVSQGIDTLPQSLINSVIYSKTQLAFANPSWLGQFASDAYIQRVRPKSTLCMPLLNRDTLSGILYLENNLLKDTFTPDRLEVLNLIGPQIAISLDNAKLHNETVNLNQELSLLNKAQARFIPREFLEILGKVNIVDVGIGDSVEKEMTVLFADIRGFTSRSEKMTPQESFKFLNNFLNVVAPIIRNHRGFIDQYLGDGFMAIFPTDADMALQAAIEILKVLKDYNSKLAENKIEEIRMGIGLNSGKVMLGTVGEAQRLEETVISDVVNTASQLQSETKVYEVPMLISGATATRLKSPEHCDIRLLDRIKLQGETEEVAIYEVFELNAPEVVLLKRQSRTEFEKAVTLFREGHREEALALFDKIAQANPADLPAAKWKTLSSRT